MKSLLQLICKIGTNCLCACIPFKSVRHRLRDYLGKFYQPVILTRTACLGNYSLERVHLSGFRFYNHQKNRIDYCLAIHQNPCKKINIEEVLFFTPEEHKHLEICYKQEQCDIFSYKHVKLLIMDSFAELTDQLFVSNNTQSSFCCHYNNVLHSDKFNRAYTCHGLLETNKLQTYYEQFFNTLRQYYGNIPIIYIHFPARFDTREKFKLRAEQIKVVLNNILQQRRNSLRLHIIEPRFVQPHETDPAVYHFSSKTYDVVAEQIKEILVQYNM